MTRLSGRVIATTRDGAPDDPLTHLLEREGAAVVSWPTLRFESPTDEGPLEQARADLRSGAFDWVVVTSARAVPSLGSGAGIPEQVRVGAVGAATAAALGQAGWTVDVTGEGDAGDFANAIAGRYDLRGAHVLFPAGSLAGRTLQETLAQLGARVERVEAYRTVLAPPDASRVRADLAAGVDAIAFASPSAVASLLEALGEGWGRMLAGVAVAAIGPSTERALVEAGLEAGRIVTAGRPGLEGLVEACVASIETTKRGST
jgi:uroporphyrinogen-III synthase